MCKGAGSASYNAAVNSTAGAITEINGGALEGTNGPALVAYGEVTLNGGTITGTYGIVSKANSDGTAAGRLPFLKILRLWSIRKSRPWLSAGITGQPARSSSRAALFPLEEALRLLAAWAMLRLPGNVVVSGGQFSTQVPESCLDGSVQAQIKKPNGTYTYYTDLEEAKEAAQSWRYPYGPERRYA